MSKIRLVSVMVLLLAGVSFGSTWNNNSGDGLWSTVGNWDAIPGSIDGVYIGSTSAAGPTINSTTTALGGWTAIGMGYSRTVTMTGGSLSLSGLTIGERGYCTGTLDISGGTATVSGWAVLGGDTSGSTNTGIITMSGNSSLTVGGLMIGNEVSDSVGNVNLSGSSVLTADSLWFRDDFAGPRLVYFNIADSAKFIVADAQVANVNYYIGQGWITGNGILNNVAVTDLEGGYSQVTVIPEPMTIGFLAIGSLLALRKRS